MHKIFINDFGRLRSGWRVLIYVLAVISTSFLIVTALRGVYLVLLEFAPRSPYSGYIADVIFRFSMLATALGVGYLCARLLEGLPWRSLGLTLHQGWMRDLIVGSAIGFASLVFAVAIATAGGGFRFSLGDAAITPIGKSMLGSGLLLFVAALAEETLFRGYALQTFSRAKLVGLGVLLTSIPFAAVHLSNPNAVPVLTFVNTALAGIWLAAAYLRTRSLWLPLGVHWAWNWALGWFFGLPISGIKLVSHPLLKAADEGPAWLTGGGYGIEGGVACTVALAVFTVFLWRTPWPKATPEMEQLTSEENPAVPSTVISIRPVNDPA